MKITSRISRLSWDVIRRSLYMAVYTYCQSLRERNDRVDGIGLSYNAFAHVGSSTPFQVAEQAKRLGVAEVDSIACASAPDRGVFFDDTQLLEACEEPIRIKI
jgi:hypothetical protein